MVNCPVLARRPQAREIPAFKDTRRGGGKVEVMDWTPWFPLIAGVLTGSLTGGIALLAMWGILQYRMGGLEARMDNLERQRAEDRAEYIRLHQEARAENIRPA